MKVYSVILASVLAIPFLSSVTQHHQPSVPKHVAQPLVGFDVKRKSVALLLASYENKQASIHKHHRRCTAHHWRHTMTTDEKWIAGHESGMDPTRADINPSSGAQELGQLLPSTLQGYGLKATWNPCGEIHNMRVYIKGRYGNAANAVQWWRAHYWY